MLQEALGYIARGWRVLPLFSVNSEGICGCGKEDCPAAGKHPKTANGVKDASRDPERVKEWFGSGGNCNLGIATGYESGITVLDIDVGPGKQGAESWSELIAEGGEPATLIAETGSGGMHVFFLYNGALKNATNVLGPGVDCRNDGGYVVAAPSVHRSGRAYRWLNEGTSVGAMPAHLALGKAQKVVRETSHETRYTLEEVKEMLEVIPADDRTDWLNFGVILGRAFDCSDEAWEAYVEWADKWQGKRGDGHEGRMRSMFYRESTKPGDLSLGTIIHKARENGWEPKSDGMSVDQFVYLVPANQYIYVVTGDNWPAASLDAVGERKKLHGKMVPASVWVRANCQVTSRTSDPNIAGRVLKGFDCVHGKLEPSDGAVYNGYNPPSIKLGDERLAGPYLEHLTRLFQCEGDKDQFLDYMAHRVQRPGEKPRFALVIAGEQGTGKDTAVDFCLPAIGEWNATSISTGTIDRTFNEYLAVTLVRVNEAASSADVNKWNINESLKVLIAGCPDYVEINPKYGRKFSVRMYCGVIITTNHLHGGFYLTEDDRRYDILQSATAEEMGLKDQEKKKKYFMDLWAWFNAGGDSHVAALLARRDISGFSAAGSQRKTLAHQQVSAGESISSSWIDDALETLGSPVAIASCYLTSYAEREGLRKENVVKQVRRLLAERGYYLFVRDNKSGRYRVRGKQTHVYTKKDCGPFKLDDISTDVGF